MANEECNKRRRIGFSSSHGMTARSKNQILAIDAINKEYGPALVDYVEDVFALHRFQEGKSQVNDYMSMQPEIDEKMRASIVDWLIKAQMKMYLTQETWYLTINIIDRYLSKEVVPMVELKLVAFAALTIAAKFEEDTFSVPSSKVWKLDKHYSNISNKAYTFDDIKAMEEKILIKLEWTLAVTTPYGFIDCFLKASGDSDSKMKNMVCFLCEIAATDYGTIKYYPSMVAASAVYVARRSLDRHPHWTETLEFYTCYSELQIRECVELIEKLQKAPANEMPRAIQKKYSVPSRDGVAFLVALRNANINTKSNGIHLQGVTNTVSIC